MDQHHATLVIPADVSPESLALTFLDWVEGQGITPYPAQEAAALSLFDNRHVVLTTPTGSGKSLVATAMHFASIARGERSYYTAPIKALVSEKFFQMREIFGHELVGMMTGDAVINPSAPLICATAEILAHDALSSEVPIGAVTMDEFHYYADRDRGWAWELPLITLTDSQFLVMSATLGDIAWLGDHLRTHTSREVDLIGGSQRPVPLTFSYSETPLVECIGDLLADGKAPVYLVHFTQRAATDQAQSLTSIDVLTGAQRARLKELMHGYRFDTPFGKDLRRFLHAGIGVHHGGLLPKYRLLVERLAGEGLLQVICGTDTLGVGVNIPIRTVMLTQLCKYDGRSTRILSIRDFHQIVGRAGRKGFDHEGFVVAQAPGHVISNKHAEAKAANSPRKRKVVKKQAPTFGYKHWDEHTFDRLVAGQPEALVSRFQLPQGALVRAMTRPGDLRAWLDMLIARSRISDDAKVELRSTSEAMIESLVDSGIVDVLEPPDADGRTLALTAELQHDFALNGELSEFLVEVVSAWDRDSESYLLDVLAATEATIEHPMALLLAQRELARTIKYNELKNSDVEYEQRQEILAAISWPEPLKAELESMFGSYLADHVWLLGSEIKPKSIAADMYLSGHTFSTYIQHLGSKRLEGTLLRYLSDVWRTMSRTIPPNELTVDVEEFIAWIASVLRSVDASLIDEWNRLVAISLGHEIVEAHERIYDLVDDPVAFRAAIRREVFRLVEYLATKRYAQVAQLAEDSAEVLDEIESTMTSYFEEYDAIDISVAARRGDLFHLDLIDPRVVAVRATQLLIEPEACSAELQLEVTVDVEQSRVQQVPVLVVGPGALKPTS